MATVTGTFKSADNTALNAGTVKLQPVSPPALSNSIMVHGQEVSITLDSNGAFSETVPEGDYYVRVDGYKNDDLIIRVPTGSGTHDITSIIYSSEYTQEPSVTSGVADWTNRSDDPATPDSGSTKVYVKSNTLYIKTSAGTVTALAAGGDVSGPGSSTDNNIVTMDGATGKVIQDSGVGITSIYSAGGTDVPVTDGGTGASTASGARTNLGLVIGTDVQAYSEVLAATTASFTTADETKLDGIEALADVTDETNVVSALSGATLTDIGTPASTDKVLIQDASDSDNLKSVAFSEFGGGTTLPVDDSTALVQDPLDNTKLVRVDAGAITPGSTRVITMGDRDVNLASGGTFAETSHNHAASEITSGTLTHERGGLEADVSAYDGLVKITGGATSAVPITAAGAALLEDANAALQRATLGLGNVENTALSTWAGSGNITTVGTLASGAVPTSLLTGTLADARVAESNVTQHEAALTITESQISDLGIYSTLPVADTTAVVKGSVDATKLVRIEADGLTTGTTRVITMPDSDVDLADIATNTAHAANTSNPHSVTKSQVGLGNVENTALSTWAGSANITTVGTVTSGNVDAVVSASSTTTAGKVELATTAETTTGTDTARAVTPDGLAGSIYGRKTIQILVSDPNGDAITTGDGKAYIRVPNDCDGMNLVDIEAHVTTASSSGTPTIQLHNVTDTVDVLSTALTIDANEKDSSTAATAAVINAANDDVSAGDELRIDIDTAGTGAKGLIVELIFETP